MAAIATAIAAIVGAGAVGGIGLTLADSGSAGGQTSQNTRTSDDSWSADAPDAGSGATAHSGTGAS
ncbi:MAG TPA: hypothetical protein VM677_00745 [Actinokineospora sp.]|nr:hypothetical protein [Actinokineospora sp.]